jgi:hypothetical protein
MNNPSNVDVREEPRCTSSGQVPDRKAMATTVNAALKSHGFCEPECALIVQIVCDALSRVTPEPVENRVKTAR